MSAASRPEDVTLPSGAGPRGWPLAAGGDGCHHAIELRLAEPGLARDQCQLAERDALQPQPFDRLRSYISWHCVINARPRVASGRSTTLNLAVIGNFHHHQCIVHIGTNFGVQTCAPPGVLHR